MLDFLLISYRSTKRGVVEIYPKFIIKKSEDLMIRGGDFYAIWIDDRKLWSTDEQDAIRLIDSELDKYALENKHKFESDIKVLHLWDSESGMIDAWHKYCQKQMRDNYNMLDEDVIFANHDTKKTDYASKKLNYPISNGECNAYDRLMSVIYSQEERQKIEWAIGSIVCGDSKKIQKFIVLYGDSGTGKSTILNIIQDLFEGYYSVFDARALGSSSNSFALEAFKNNPLVAIQHDGDLSRIEDNTRLNSLVSHEIMTVNEKFKSTYANRFKSFLFMGTNKPVKITDAKSGLIRRLIDVSPSGNKLSVTEYKKIIKQIPFELGAIANRCKNVYLDNKHFYDDYIPINMLSASNDFYNFILDSFNVFSQSNSISLKAAWAMYKEYCEDAKVLYPHPQRVFKEELKNYFDNYHERYILDDGSRIRNFYIGFKTNKFTDEKKIIPTERTIIFKEQASIFDNVCGDYFAQYATENETPMQKWDGVETRLKDLNSKELHYVRLPQDHIVIDFDIKDNNGNKSLVRNMEEASKFPETYSELSKSGKGIHLHYIYDGDTSRLKTLYSENIEVKIFNGNSSLRRKLSLCNDIPIKTINSGLPLKEEKKILDNKNVISENGIRKQIVRNLNKEIHGATKPSMDFIKKILDDAYESGMKYDLSDMRSAIFEFAINSTNQSDYCVKLISKLKLKSDEPSVMPDVEAPIVFYDVEVFPNLLVICWKKEGNSNVVQMINPKPTEIEALLNFRLIGFNCRRYDNHILYATMLGYSNEQLYTLSQNIINGISNSFFGEAYGISYTDVYDFSSKKQSLKKFEIELGICHKELGLPWNEPVPEEKWLEVAAYCDNDVIATEEVFNNRKADFLAREILADLADMSVNDTTNTLTSRIIFGNERKPQSSFNYRNMGDKQNAKKLVFSNHDFDVDYTVFDRQDRPIFPDYIYENGKSYYRGEEVGEGGYVYSEPGIYENAVLLDVASMHPTSIVAENLFGDVYTSKFKALLDARLAIKHGDFEQAKEMLGGKLEPYLKDKGKAMDLAYALKIAINSVYGLTSAHFDNPFMDIRNKDNIVAKRGALFMINLKHELQRKGFTVAHIKTDSIKIPNATPEIIQFIFDYGKLYDYIFEHETTYEKMCLVNDAVYVAKDINGEWSATGTQFAVPYVFKSIFSKEEICFDDLCETKAVSTALYLDMNENLQEEHNYKFVGKVGRFCPIKPECGGGLLMREKDGKYYAATGTKGYRWMESEMVKSLKKEKDIDTSYYDKLVIDAVDSIAKYGDVEKFII